MELDTIEGDAAYGATFLPLLLWLLNARTPFPGKSCVRRLLNKAGSSRPTYVEVQA